MPTKQIDHQFGYFYAELKVTYENAGDMPNRVCRIDAGSVTITPHTQSSNPLFELGSQQQYQSPTTYDSPKTVCMSTQDLQRNSHGNQDYILCWFRGTAVLRSPSLKIPFTNFGLPGFVIPRSRTNFKLVLRCYADGSTKHEVYENQVSL